MLRDRGENQGFWVSGPDNRLRGWRTLSCVPAPFTFTLKLKPYNQHPHPKIQTLHPARDTLPVARRDGLELCVDPLLELPRCLLES